MDNIAGTNMDTRITLHKLEVFREVVESSSVTRAAEKLFVAQPVVTAHIRSLEERIGARLFYREGRQLHLTEAGTAAYRWAQDVLTRTQELDRHIEALSDGMRGTVALAASNSIGSYRLPPVVSAFRAERPLVHLQLNIWDSERALDATRSGEADFAVIIAGSPPSDQGLAAEQIGHEEVAVVAAPECPAPERLTTAQLAALPFIETPAGLIRRSHMDEQLAGVGIEERRIVMELGHPEAMKWAVKADLGVALLFRSSVSAEIARGELRELHVEGAAFAVPVFLVHRKGKLFSSVHTDLVEAIRAAFAAPHDAGEHADAGVAAAD